ncbi:hypothetical protein JCM10213v2_002883 [Rhodosporidiobolus nylandii]
MASQKLHDCLICPKRTSLRCAGSSAEDKDSAVFFCSREHQRLGWPAHRVFCKNGGAFTFPPLTKEEADTLARLQRNPKSPVAPVLSQLAGMGLWGGNWATLEMEMQSSSSSVSEPERTAILIVLRKRLVNHFEHSNPLSPLSSRNSPPTATGQMSATELHEEHQKLLWPTHKVLCQARGAVVVAWLSQQEIHLLRPLGNHALEYDAQQGTFASSVRYYRMFEGDWPPIPEQAVVVHHFSAMASTGTMDLEAKRTLRLVDRHDLPPRVKTAAKVVLDGDRKMLDMVEDVLHCGFKPQFHRTSMLDCGLMER